MSECNHDCSSCSENCASREQSRESFLVPQNELSNVKNVIGVVSGKGGVGKSTVTSLLSVMTAKKGFKTIKLQVFSENLPAMALYKKTGFCITQTLSFYEY